MGTSLNIVPSNLINDTRYHGRLYALVEISKSSDNQFFPVHKTYRVDYGDFSFKTAKFPITVNYLLICCAVVFIIILICACKQSTNCANILRFRFMRAIFNEFDEDAAGSAIQVDIISELKYKKDKEGLDEQKKMDDQDKEDNKKAKEMSEIKK